ncbi:SGNH/GDSL hydrolase family protein [Rossellomorea vietnamensis]|uniref:SGNH/GDSL hydrolase family protein n=1 Tax=Rossellomorea vietnamensis TaxID=218284 RepID=UPI00077C595E|nr:SGNH/GDSL hydrolase family protein [Rossellomorea vietnamensis]
MKNASLFLLAILTIAFLILGNIYWQERTKMAAEGPVDTKVSDTETISPVTETEKGSEPSYEELTGNWPEKARKQFLEAVKSNEPYKVAIVGSPALGAAAGGWSDLLKQELTQTYGDHIDVNLFQTDETSTEFMYSATSEEVVSYKPDLVLWEPFTLKDNTVGVSAEDTAYSINSFLSDLQEANKEVTLILQPGTPLYGAVFYPKQVDELKAFAEESSLTYLDHWSAWPASDDEALQEYLAESKDVPSEKGHDLWAGYLIRYFVSK